MECGRGDRRLSEGRLSDAEWRLSDAEWRLSDRRPSDRRLSEGAGTMPGAEPVRRRQDRAPAALPSADRDEDPVVAAGAVRILSQEWDPPARLSPLARGPTGCTRQSSGRGSLTGRVTRSASRRGLSGISRCGRLQGGRPPSGPDGLRDRPERRYRQPGRGLVRVEDPKGALPQAPRPPQRPPRGKARRRWPADPGPAPQPREAAANSSAEVPSGLTPAPPTLRQLPRLLTLLETCRSRL